MINFLISNRLCRTLQLYWFWWTLITVSICQNLFPPKPQWALFNFAHNYRRISLCVRSAIHKLSIRQIDFSNSYGNEQRRSFQYAVWHSIHGIQENPQWTWKGLFSIAQPIGSQKIFHAFLRSRICSDPLARVPALLWFCMLKMFSQNEWSHFIEIFLECARHARARNEAKSFSTNFF